MTHTLESLLALADDIERTAINKSYHSTTGSDGEYGQARAALSEALAYVVKDMERYQWLRESESEHIRVMTYIDGLDDWLAYANAEDVDAAIDKTMKGTP